MNKLEKSPRYPQLSAEGNVHSYQKAETGSAGSYDNVASSSSPTPRHRSLSSDSPKNKFERIKFQIKSLKHEKVHNKILSEAAYLAFLNCSYFEAVMYANRLDYESSSDTTKGLKANPRKN